MDHWGDLFNRWRPRPNVRPVVRNQNRIHRAWENQKLALKSISVYTLPQPNRRQVTEHTFSEAVESLIGSNTLVSEAVRHD